MKRTVSGRRGTPTPKFRLLRTYDDIRAALEPAALLPGDGATDDDGAAPHPPPPSPAPAVIESLATEGEEVGREIMECVDSFQEALSALELAVQRRREHSSEDSGDGDAEQRPRPSSPHQDSDASTLDGGQGVLAAGRARDSVGPETGADSGGDTSPMQPPSPPTSRPPTPTAQILPIPNNITTPPRFSSLARPKSTAAGSLPLPLPPRDSSLSKEATGWISPRSISPPTYSSGSSTAARSSIAALSTASSDKISLSGSSRSSGSCRTRSGRRRSTLSLKVVTQSNPSIPTILEIVEELDEHLDVVMPMDGPRQPLGITSPVEQEPASPSSIVVTPTVESWTPLLEDSFYIPPRSSSRVAERIEVVSIFGRQAQQTAGQRTDWVDVPEPLTPRELAAFSRKATPVKKHLSPVEKVIARVPSLAKLIHR